MFYYANLEEFLLMLALVVHWAWLRANYPFTLLRSYSKCFCACKCL